MDIVERERERNHRTFEGINVLVVLLKSSCIRTLFEWSGVLGPNNFDNVVDFIGVLSFCM